MAIVYDELRKLAAEKWPRTGPDTPGIMTTTPENAESRHRRRTAPFAAGNGGRCGIGIADVEPPDSLQTVYPGASLATWWPNGVRDPAPFLISLVPIVLLQHGWAQGSMAASAACRHVLPAVRWNRAWEPLNTGGQCRRACSMETTLMLGTSTSSTRSSFQRFCTPRVPWPRYAGRVVAATGRSRDDPRTASGHRDRLPRNARCSESCPRALRTAKRTKRPRPRSTCALAVALSTDFLSAWCWLVCLVLGWSQGGWWWKPCLCGLAVETAVYLWRHRSEFS